MSTSEGAGTHINTLMQLHRECFPVMCQDCIRKLLQFQRTYSEYLFTNDLFWKCLVTTKATIFIQLTKYTSQFTSQLPNSDTSISLPLPHPPTNLATKYTKIPNQYYYFKNPKQYNTQMITEYFQSYKNNHNFSYSKCITVRQAWRCQFVP